MKQILKTLTLSSILASGLLASEDSLIYSLGLNMGVSHTPYTQSNSNGSITLGNTPDEKLNSYEIYTVLNPLTDLCKQKNMKPTISYTYSNNSDLKHQYILAGLNKYYHNSYAGIVLGYGELEYRYNPLNSSKTNDYTATSPIIGLQTGYDYLLTKNLTLGFNSKALYHDYEATLNPNNTATSLLEHDYTINASVGIEWRF